MTMAQVRMRVDMEDLLPARIESALKANHPKMALITLVLSAEEAREKARRAERKAKERELAREQRKEKLANRTSIIVKCAPEDELDIREGKWSLLKPDASGGSRTMIAALNEDEERERRAAVAALRAQQEAHRANEAERIDRERRARRASLPSADRRRLEKDEARMRGMVAPEALNDDTSEEHIGKVRGMVNAASLHVPPWSELNLIAHRWTVVPSQITRLLRFFEEFEVTDPVLLEQARRALELGEVLARCRRLRVEAVALKRLGRVDEAREKLRQMNAHKKSVPLLQSSMSAEAAKAAVVTAAYSERDSRSSTPVAAPTTHAAGAASQPEAQDAVPAVVEWVQCEEPSCRKWRKLPPNIKARSLNIATFTCSRNFWAPAEASCEAPEQTENRTGEREFVVEMILAARSVLEGGVKQKQYLVKWKGYPDSDNSWEPVANCVGCDALIAAFESSSAGLAASSASALGQQQPVSTALKATKNNAANNNLPVRVSGGKRIWSGDGTGPPVKKQAPAPPPLTEAELADAARSKKRKKLS